MKSLPKSFPIIKKTLPGNRLLIVDDHPVTRDGISLWMRRDSDFSFCDEAGTAAHAMESVVALRPDFVVTSIALPGRSGLELIKDIYSLRPDLPVLVFSVHDEALYAERALRAGARGYLMKREGGQMLLSAVRRVMGGQVYVSEKTSERLLGLVTGKVTHSSRPGVEQLSDREFDVFQFLGQGLSANEIGTRMNLCPKTIDAHRANIKRKLVVKTSSSLVSYAAQWNAHQDLLPPII